MTPLLTIAQTLVEIVGIVALADLLAGFVHWLEDAYFTENTPVIGPLFIKPNIVHHHYPRHFTKLNWWESSREAVLVGLVVLGVALPLGYFSWQLALFVAVSANANQIHKWSHRTRAENGPIVSRLQDWGILQTPRHHGLHHTDPKNTFYCPVTNWVNPVLEKIEFWNRLEKLIERVTGVRHRDDTAVRGQGPGPDWLVEFRPAPARPISAAEPAPVLHAAFSPSHRGNRPCRGCAKCPGHCGRHQLTEKRAA